MANKVMKFVGLQENVDYAETNQSVEEGLALHARKLPDAMFVVSTALSYKMIENIQKGFGLAMTLLTLCLMMVKWFSGSGLDDNGSFKAYIKQVGEIEDEVARLRQQPEFDAVRLQELIAGFWFR